MGEQQPKKDYTIKFITPNGDTKNIRLSGGMLKYSVASLVIMALLFVGAFSYAVYGTFVAQETAGEVRDLREVNTIQQEQLLDLAKKASSLQDDLNQLKKLEDDLRQMTGTPEPQPENKETEAKEAHDGQGGPVSTPTIANVSDTLDSVAAELKERRESLIALREKLEEERAPLVAAAAINSNNNMPSGVIPAIWPASGDVSSPYGLRWGGSDFHPGIDIANDMGTPIMATADGTVVTAGYNSGGYGNMVDIDHGNGLMTRYGHAMQVLVSEGQTVRRGQVIALMGSTGFSTGPHVHYEVRINGQAVNPAAYLH